MFINRVSLIIGLVAILAGCGGSSGTAMDDGATAGDGYDSGDDGARSSGAGDDGFMSGDEYDDPTGPGGILEVRVIYFEFDRAEIDEASQSLLAEHGTYLAENPGVDVRLEGHGANAAVASTTSVWVNDARRLFARFCFCVAQPRRNSIRSVMAKNGRPCLAVTKKPGA